MTKFRCTVCGYIHEGEPADLPVKGRTGKFEKLEEVAKASGRYAEQRQRKT